jgi:hypothetical protein
MDDFREGLGDAWAAVATFLPKLVAFIAILIIGYLVAKLIERVLDKVLERVGFDRWVERGGVKRALDQSKFDASSILAKVVFWAAMLFVLQVAFSVFGPNAISELIQSAIAYLPNIFVAIVIIVIASALAAGVKDIVQASIGGLSYGRALAVGASAAILVIGIFAALNQLKIAPAIVNGLFYALLAIIVGSAVVAIGGGGIPTMRRYWERGANRADAESENVRRYRDSQQAAAPATTPTTPVPGTTTTPSSTGSPGSTTARREP